MAEFSVTGADLSEAASVGVDRGPTGVWGGFFPSGRW
jgi:hypothetical protein